MIEEKVPGGVTYKLKRKCPYYYQVQGNLNILNKQKCYFVVYGKYLDVDEKNQAKWIDWIYTEVISRDERLWLDVMVPKLTRYRLKINLQFQFVSLIYNPFLLQILFYGCFARACKSSISEEAECH